MLRLPGLVGRSGIRSYLLDSPPRGLEKQSPTLALLPSCALIPPIPSLPSLLLEGSQSPSGLRTKNFGKRRAEVASFSPFKP